MNRDKNRRGGTMMKHYYIDRYGCSFHAGDETRPCTCREYIKDDNEVSNKAAVEDHDRVVCACNGGACKASFQEKREYKNSREQLLLNAPFSQRKNILNGLAMCDVLERHISKLAKKDPKAACEIMRTA